MDEKGQILILLNSNELKKLKDVNETSFLLNSICFLASAVGFGLLIVNVSRKY